MRLLLGPVILVLALAVRPLTAAAAPATPSADEQRSFADGLRLFRAGDARGAEKAWKAGYAAGHNPAFLVRIGEAEEQAGAPAEAVQSYQRYLRESPDASNSADIEARIHRLAPTAASHAPAADEDAPGTLPEPGAAPTPPTPAAPSAPPPGGSTVTATGRTAGAPTPSVPSTPLTPRSTQTQDDEELRALVDENPGARTRLNVAGWVGSGVTVILLGVAAYFGARASEKSGDVNRLLTSSDPKTGVPPEYSSVAAQYESAVHDGQQADRLAKGFLLGAGIVAAGSAALFIIDAVRAPEAAPGGVASSAGPGTGVRPFVTSVRDARLPGLGLAWGF